MPLDPLSEDAKLIAAKVASALQAAAADDCFTEYEPRPSLRGILHLTIEGDLNLNRLAVQLAQLFWEELPCHSTRCPKTPS